MIILNKMLGYLAKKAGPSYQSELEAYISAHNPICPADVERLIKEYTYGSFRVWL